MNLAEYCRENGKEYLLQEWDKEQNKVLPEQLSFQSHSKVWWKCSLEHPWKCEVKDRTNRETGCPYCTNKKVLAGYNDLATTHAEIVLEWNVERNGENCTPDKVTAGSEKKVWWKCVLEHEWQATVENRALKGNACPYCSGKRAWPGFNDLATLFPDLAAEWDMERNVDIDISRTRLGCHRKAWWMCKNGHTWEARIFSRTSKKRPGCPVCAGRVSV